MSQKLVSHLSGCSLFVLLLCKGFRRNATIDVGTEKYWEHVPPQDSAINKEVAFLFQENVPFFLKEKVNSKRRASQV